MIAQVQEVLNFWFGALTNKADVPHYKMSMWFANGADYDDEIREKFLNLHNQVFNGQLETWRNNSYSLLALIILLDQFSRYICRNTAQAFAQDEKVVRIVKQGIETGWYQKLYFIQRKFFYMPLMQAENIETQELSVTMFARLHDEVPDELKELFSKSLSFAESHYYVISKFGRFPELNEILDRQSSPSEIEFLKRGKYRFL